MTEDLQNLTDSDLPNEAFADDVNRLFPIDDAVAVTQSFDNFGLMPYKIYDTADYLYVLDKICKAAEEFEVELNLEESTGGKKMIDINSQEFRDEVQKKVDLIMADFVDKDKRAKAIEELKIQLASANEILTKATKENEVIQAEKEKIEQSFKEYRDQVEATDRVRERMLSLAEIGLKFADEETKKETEEAVAEMSDKAFSLYKKQLAEVITQNAAMMTEEEKKKMLLEEEKKKKDKEKNKSKASTDIVAESKAEGSLPNGEIDEDPFKTFNSVLSKI
jgi:predicted metal-binding transcription factor (methanogenesis marker protein 9)